MKALPKFILISRDKLRARTQRGLKSPSDIHLGMIRGMWLHPQWLPKVERRLHKCRRQLQAKISQQSSQDISSYMERSCVSTKRRSAVEM